MRIFLALAALGGTAVAGPVGRIGTVGGYDASSPSHRSDGLALGAGYYFGPVTTELAYSYLDYNAADGIGGGAHRLGALVQTKLFQMTCEAGRVCPHFDLDLGIGYRWLHWEPGSMSTYDANNASVAPTVDHQGKEVTAGVSATFGWHFALHYVVFTPDDNQPTFTCRGVCPMKTTGNNDALLLEASFAWGGS